MEIAAQVALAFNNARLLQIERERSNELILLEVSQAATSSLATRSGTAADCPRESGNTGRGIVRHHALAALRKTSLRSVSMSRSKIGRVLTAWASDIESENGRWTPEFSMIGKP